MTDYVLCHLKIINEKDKTSYFQTCKDPTKILAKLRFLKIELLLVFISRNNFIVHAQRSKRSKQNLLPNS